MNKEDIAGLTAENFGRFREKLSNDKVEVYEDAKKQIDPEQHAVITDKIRRKDKVIQVEYEENGEKKTRPDTVYVARIALSLQKLIVKRAKAFLTGNPIVRNANAEKDIEKSLVEVINKTWDDNKLDFKTSELASIMMSEGEAAELWYVEPVDPDYWNGTPNQGSQFKIRSRVLANAKGDSLFPVYDQYGDMIAFGREYTVTEEGKKVVKFTLYTDIKIQHYVKKDGVWDLELDEKNIIGKIPIIYFSQDQVEWADVQTLIDRLETLVSNYADTIDYFGSPIMKARGDAFSLPSKAGSGKVVQVEGSPDETDVSYLTWDMKPEAVIFEFENIYKLIHVLTQTPDISFESVKGLGQFSGIALKLLFMDAHLKAHEHWANFGEGIQRRINFIKAAMGVINLQLKPALSLSIKPEFTPFMPTNELEAITMLGQAVTDGFLSKQTAIERNPLVADAEIEKERVKEEKIVVDPLEAAA